MELFFSVRIFSKCLRTVKVSFVLWDNLSRCFAYIVLLMFAYINLKSENKKSVA